MSRIKTWLIVLLCLCTAGALAESENLIAEDLIKADKVNYNTVLAEVGVFERIFNESASEYYPNTYVLSFDREARFGEMLVSRGDDVKAGDVLATFLLESDAVDMASRRQQLENAKAELERSAEDQREAIAEMEMSLLDVKDALEKELLALRIERAEISLEQYIHNQERAIAQIEKGIAELEAEMADNVLIAPADGVIEELNFKRAGERVYAGEALILMSRTDGMLLRIDNSAGNFRYGMEVTVEVGANNKSRQTFPGRVVGADTLVPAAERSGYAYVEFENPENLKLVRAAVQGAGVYLDNVLLLPRNAVKLSGGKNYVTKLEDGVPGVRYLNCVLVSGGKQAWVLQGLETGDEIIIE